MLHLVARQNFFKIQSWLGFELEDFAKQSSIDLDKIKEFVLRPEKSDINTSMRIAHHFQLTVEEFLYGEVNRQWIVQPQLGQRFLFSAGSKVRNILSVLQYVRQNYGENLYQYVLSKLKVPRGLLLQTDQVVSINLLSDVLELLANRGIPPYEFKQMGFASVEMSHNSILKKEFVGLKSAEQALQKLFDEVIYHYEKNFEYKMVSKKENSIVVEVIARPERMEDFKSKCIDNSWVQLYRQGAIAGHLKWVGCQSVHTQTVSSFHMGDVQEKFYLSY